jgi:hypothetical protein
MNKYKPVLLCICSTFGLMTICFYNRYPFYDGDTHSYLYTAFHTDLPIERPPFYGKFIRLTSLWTSLWFTIFSQCLILAYLLVRYISLLNPGKSVLRFGMLSMLSIVGFTCVSWVCTYLCPDIFGGILLMGILLYLFDKNPGRIHSILYLAIILFGALVHNSHFLIIVLFSVSILIYALIRKYKPWLKKGLTLLSVAALTYLSICTLNYRYGRGFTFSPASQLFIVAKFASNGILKTYLDDNCEKKNLKLCACKDEITPYPWEFMWPAPSTQLSKIGVWDSSSREFKGIVKDIFTTPKYLKMYLVKSFFTTFQQFCEIQVEKPLYRPTNTPANGYFNIYFSDEYNDFLASRQNNNTLDPSGFNMVYYLFFALSSLWVLLLYAQSKNKEIALIYGCILVFFLINAYVTANFSTVCFRFQYRVFWILPATNAILILKYLQERYKDRLKEEIN